MPVESGSDDLVPLFGWGPVRFLERTSGQGFAVSRVPSVSYRHDHTGLSTIRSYSICWKGVEASQRTRLRTAPAQRLGARCGLVRRFHATAQVLSLSSSSAGIHRLSIRY